MSCARVLHISFPAVTTALWPRAAQGQTSLHLPTAEAATAAHEPADRALANAHRLDCEVWSTRQFIGGPDEPSPAIAAALHGGCELLEVQCRHCKHTQTVDLTEVIWPRERPVHTLRKALYCQRCMKEDGRKRRPDLLALRARETAGPTAPAAISRSR